MTSIDKYWDDRVIYHVGFLANILKIDGTREEKEFYRTFIFPESLCIEEIKALIFLKLDNIIDIIYVEGFMDALELRDEELLKGRRELEESK